MTSTTLKKLERLHDMVIGEETGSSWWTNPNDHPRPTLPGQNHLEGRYLADIRRSAPHLEDRVTQLVQFAKTNRVD